MSRRRFDYGGGQWNARGAAVPGLRHSRPWCGRAAATTRRGRGRHTPSARASASAGAVLTTRLYRRTRPEAPCCGRRGRTYTERLTLALSARGTPAARLWEWFGATVRKTGATRAFDTWGNITTQRSLGNLDLDGDERRTLTEYPAEHRRTSSSACRSGSGSTRPTTRRCCGRRECSTTARPRWTPRPFEGDVTRLDRVLFGTTSQVVSQRFGYDNYGNQHLDRCQTVGIAGAPDRDRRTIRPSTCSRRR